MATRVIFIVVLFCCAGGQGDGTWGDPVVIPAPDTSTTTSSTSTTLNSPYTEQTPDPPPLGDGVNADPECTEEQCGLCHCCFKLRETSATCSGSNITDIPTDLPSNLTQLILRDTDIVNITVAHGTHARISKFSYYGQLERLKMIDNAKLTEIGGGAFDALFNSLKFLSIDGSKNIEFNHGIFGFHELVDLIITHCDLSRVPQWTKGTFGYGVDTIHIDLSNNKILELPKGAFAALRNTDIGSIDLSNNGIRQLNTGTFGGSLKIGTIKLQKNRLEIIRDHAFNGSSIKTLILSDNTNLTTLESHSFTNSAIQHLDLSRTAVTKLPTDGLQTLRNLTILQTNSLQTFPSVLDMGEMVVARLTYPQHCCAFDHPEIQNITRYEEFVKVMEAECSTSNSTVTTTSFTGIQSGQDTGFGGFVVTTSSVPRGLKSTLDLLRRKRSNDNITQHDLWHSNDDGGLYGDIGHGDYFYHDYDFEDVDESGFHPHTINPDTEHVITRRCGDVERSKKVDCKPKPDAFNPCEDVLGFAWLRIMAWIVVIIAVAGNIVVIIVSLCTLCTKYRLTGLSVSKFLICNLAFADLTLGLYLLILAAYDLSSMGQYFTGAIIWQYNGGCSVVGFLATFSTCLSTFTLTVITCERWYTIRYAMNPDRRLRLRLASLIMICGWAFALIMAMLPLVGISSYTKTSVCLPMDISTNVNKGYIFILMLINIFCLIIICVCYVDMYLKVRTDDNSSAVRRSDANIAKRMAFLVFTDFACLFPIFFFALSAAIGYPLMGVTYSKILLVVFFPLNACANPILYVIATKQFRKDFIHMLSRCGFCERKASEYRLAMTSNPMSMSHSRNSLSGVMQQNIIHRPSVGSTLPNSTYVDYHRKSKGSSSNTNGSLSNKALVTAPGDVIKTSGLNSHQNNYSGQSPLQTTPENRKLSMVLEDSLASGNNAQVDIHDNQHIHNQSCSYDSSDGDLREMTSACRVRSVSEYSDKPLMMFGKSMDGIDCDKYGRKVNATTNLTNISETTFTTMVYGPTLECPSARTLGRRKHRITHTSIPGDSGFGEMESGVVEIGSLVDCDMIPASQSLVDVFHSSSSTDTSICPMSDKTSSSNGNGDDAISTEKLSPMENYRCLDNLLELHNGPQSCR